MCLMGYNQEVASEKKALVFHASAENWAAVAAAKGELKEIITKRKLAQGLEDTRAPQPEVPVKSATQAAASTGLQQPMSVAFKVDECVSVNWEEIQRGKAGSGWHSGVVEKVQCHFVICSSIYFSYCFLLFLIVIATVVAICSIAASVHATNQTSMWFQVMAATIRVRYESGEFADHGFRNLPPIGTIGVPAYAATVWNAVAVWCTAIV